MKILLLLGKDDRYLDFRAFKTDDELDVFLDSIANLMLLNIYKELPLKERLKHAPEYFPFAGAVEGFDVIDLDEENDEHA